MPQGKGIPGSDTDDDLLDLLDEPAVDEREREKTAEFAATGGRAPDDPLRQILDEGVTAGHAGGQLRGDQTEGHRGGSWRQNKNRGRG